MQQIKQTNKNKCAAAILRLNWSFVMQDAEVDRVRFQPRLGQASPDSSPTAPLTHPCAGMALQFLNENESWCCRVVNWRAVTQNFAARCGAWGSFSVSAFRLSFFHLAGIRMVSGYKPFFVIAGFFSPPLKKRQLTDFPSLIHKALHYDGLNVCRFPLAAHTYLHWLVISFVIRLRLTRRRPHE